MTAGAGPRTGTRRVLVTGGGSGIGRAVASRLVAAGGRVALLGRRPGPLEEMARAHPGAVLALPCDLADPTARSGVVARARELLGGLDGLVHCAGQVVHQPLGHIDEAALRSQLEINLVAPLRLGEEALRELEPGGAMVFVSSTLAERPIRTSAVYSAGKAGLHALVKVLALEGARRGVRVNVVAPGVVDSEMVRVPRLEPGEPEPSTKERESRIAAQLEFLRTLHPLGRLGEPEDVAEAVLHLLGAPWTTGSVLTVDGGLLLRE